LSIDRYQCRVCCFVKVMSKRIKSRVAIIYIPRFKYWGTTSQSGFHYPEQLVKLHHRPNLNSLQHVCESDHVKRPETSGMLAEIGVCIITTAMREMFVPWFVISFHHIFISKVVWYRGGVSWVILSYAAREDDFTTNVLGWWWGRMRHDAEWKMSTRGVRRSLRGKQLCTYTGRFKCSSSKLYVKQFCHQNPQTSRPDVRGTTLGRLRISSAAALDEAKAEPRGTPALVA
jgi:hypothetical protein